ncbi:MAG TPA: response regulator [bacterium]|nr:response regulator [bacterium]HPN45825.1 response regulator [bacterium]
MSHSPEILIVEDERIIAEDIKKTLQEMDYTVSAIVNSGVDALRQIEQKKPDLILMDIIIKGEIDGIETASLIRKTYDIPVVFLTAHADRLTLEKVKQTEPFGYLIKPYGIKELQVVIETALYKHSMEKQLKESRTWFLTTLTSIGDGVIATDQYGKITFMNTVAEKLTGWRQTDAIGKQITQIFHIKSEVTGQTAANPVDTVLKTAAIAELETQVVLVAKSGLLIPIDDSAAPIQDSQGNIIGVVLVFHDITERKKAEYALRLAEKEKTLILDSLAELVIYLDPQLNILWANKPAANILKLSGPETKKHFCYMHWHESAEPCMQCPVVHALQTNQIHQQEIKSPDGRIWLVKAYPVRDDYNFITGVVEVTLEITEQKKAEERLNLALEVTSDAIWDWNYITGDAYFSPRYYTMLGYDPNEFPARFQCWLDLLHPDDKEESIRKVNEHIEGKRSQFEFEFRMKTKSGDWKWVLARGKVVERDENGKVLRLLGTHVDISERRALENKLIQAQKMDSIGNLAGGVAHDFNNMLGGIMGYASLLLYNITDEKNRTYVENIISSAERAADLTRQLLAFGRRGKNLIENININDIVQQVLKIIKHTIDKSIKISITLNPKTALIDGDPTQIEQTVMNLLINAVESMPTGGLLNIKTDNTFLDSRYCENHPNVNPGVFLKLSISDTGYGMTEEVQKHIFEPFFTTKKDGHVKGTGLGLATVYGIIRNHNGIIEVESQVNKGSTFTVYFPESKHEREKPTKKIKSEIRTGKGTILVVDDEDIVRDMVHEMIASFGYNVVTAVNGLEAVKIYKEKYREFDCVIIDMIMPDMGGKETFIEMKKINPDVKALLATGFAQDGRAQEIIDLGVQSFLQKPFNLAELSQKIALLCKPPALE